MSQINADFNQSGNSIFENVYIYGTLEAVGVGGTGGGGNVLTIGSDATLRDLTVTGTSIFHGPATFNDTLTINEDLAFDNLELANSLNVGVGGTLIYAKANHKPEDGGSGFSAVGIGTSEPRQFLDIQGIGVAHTFGIGVINPRDELDVVGNSIFEGDVRILAGDVGIGTLDPVEKLQINYENSSVVVTAGGTVGIGTSNPWNPEYIVGLTEPGKLRLAIDGSVSIKRYIYDSADSVGSNGYYLKRDSNGIRWAEASPIAMEGIYVQENGHYLPTVGTAQTFSTINFTQINSLGTGVDNVIAVPDPNNTTDIARIQSKDLWGFTDSGNIYRLTNVGIANNNPSETFQVGSGEDDDGGIPKTFVVNDEGDVGIGVLTPATGVGLDVYKSTYIRRSFQVSGVSTFVNDVNIKANNKHFNIQNAYGVDKFTVDTDDGTTIIEGITTIENIQDSASYASGALVVKGGIGVAKDIRLGEELYLATNKKAFFGDSQDLKIYHSGSHGFTENTSGNLYLKNSAGKILLHANSDTYISNNDGSEIRAAFYDSAQVDLYYEGNTKFGTLSIGATVYGELGISTGLQVAGVSTFNNDVEFKEDINVEQTSTFVGFSTFKDKVGIAKTLDLGSYILDVNQDIGVGVAKTDYRLASVGTGVSWRPSGVETENAIWVSVDGMDTNTGLLEGDAKRTIGGAAAIAQAGDTIIVRSGVYKENNPVGLRTEVSISGEDLRLVTVVPLNPNKDVFHVRAGCLIQNLNFAGLTKGTDHTNCGAVAFPPTTAGIAGGVDFQAVTGYTALGPANQGPDRIDPTKGGRYRSPYTRNCTNFMTGSTGMKINGNYVDASFTGTNDLGQDLKSMVCDSFTQYNEAGIGVSITNNAYAQLVSIFTIACEKAIYCDTGGQCDLTNSNSSFGTYGLYSDGYGDIEFEGVTKSPTSAEVDVVNIDNVTDIEGNFRKPFDGQGLYFHINLDDYDDVSIAGQVTQPLQLVRNINVTFGGNTGDYSPGAPPIVTVNNPLGPEAILAEFSPNVSAAGTITSIDVINSGRNFLPNQVVNVSISGGGSATAVADMDPILFTVERATEPDKDGLSNVTLNEFLPYSVGAGVKVDFVRLSRIITSSHSFEYVGAGTDINRANPFQGGEPIPKNEIVAINGGQVPFTSTDQKGNFRIGEGLVIDQTTSTISGRDFNRAIQAQLTPLILALR